MTTDDTTSRRAMLAAILGALDAPSDAAEHFDAYLRDLRAVASAYLTACSHGNANDATRAAILGERGAHDIAQTFISAGALDTLSAVCFGLRGAADALAAGELAPEDVDIALADLAAARAGLPADKPF